MDVGDYLVSSVSCHCGGMKNRLIVGFDGSEPSVAALRWAAQEAELRGASVRVVTSYAMPLVAPGIGGEGALFVDMSGVADALRAHATEVSAEVFADHPSVAHDVEVLALGPSLALSQATVDADLVVVGSSGASRLSRFLLGSVTRSLLGSSSCPVVVVPPDPVPVTKRILVGTDGSDHSKRAVEWAANEADRHGSILVVAHAWQYPYGFTIEGVDLRDGIARVDAALLLDQAVEAAREITGSEVQSELIESGDVEALLELSKSADLLVAGASGRGRVATALFGSVAQSIATHAICPTVIVR